MCNSKRCSYLFDKTNPERVEYPLEVNVSLEFTYTLFYFKYFSMLQGSEGIPANTLRRTKFLTCQ